MTKQSKINRSHFDFAQCDTTKLKMKKILNLSLTLSLSLTLFFACDKNDKPVNLSVAREEVQKYYESGKYDEELNKIVADAKKEFDKIKFNSNSVVIFRNSTQ